MKKMNKFGVVTEIFHRKKEEGIGLSCTESSSFSAGLLAEDKIIR